jgi:hypothetical protein
MYESGNGVPKSYAEAVQWCCLAAAQGTGARSRSFNRWTMPVLEAIPEILSLLLPRI